MYKCMDCNTLYTPTYFQTSCPACGSSHSEYVGSEPPLPKGVEIKYVEPKSSLDKCYKEMLEAIKRHPKRDE